MLIVNAPDAIRDTDAPLRPVHRPRILLAFLVSFIWIVVLGSGAFNDLPLNSEAGELLGHLVPLLTSTRLAI